MDTGQGEFHKGTKTNTKLPKKLANQFQINFPAVKLFKYQETKDKTRLSKIATYQCKSSDGMVRLEEPPKET